MSEVSPAEIGRALAPRLHDVRVMQTIPDALLATATGGMLRNTSQRDTALVNQLTSLQDSIKSVATASQTAQQQQQSQQTMMMMMAMMAR